MCKIAEKIKNLPQTTYQIIAEKFDTNTAYVGQIARGERIPKRGKGLKIKKELDKIITP